MSILTSIKSYKIQEVEQSRREVPLSVFESLLPQLPPSRGFHAAMESRMARGQVALVAEIKRASPSKGLLRERFEAGSIAQAYQQGGATCLSVLTDAYFFQGKADDLQLARSTSSLPILRKDFIVDPYQVYESKAMNADCILLIMSMIGDDRCLKDLMETALRLGMEALVEVHDEEEAERALSMNARLVGTNNRNLVDFSVDLGVSERLVKILEPHSLVVSESGISSAAEVLRLKTHGIKGFLIGEQLMRAPDIEHATRSVTCL